MYGDKDKIKSRQLVVTGMLEALYSQHKQIEDTIKTLQREQRICNDILMLHKTEEA